MRKKIYLIFLLLPIFFGSQCHKDKECHKNILFVNNSIYPLYVLGDFEGYPDTLSFIHSGGFVENDKVNPQTSSSYPLELRDCYEARFNSSYFSDTLLIYVFNADTVDNNPWSYIYENYKVLHRYELTLDNLNRMNWTITYP